MKTLAEVLRDEGYSVIAYSGRGMYGKECLGVKLDEGDSLFNLGFVMGGAAETNVDLMDLLSHLPTPRTDSLGRGTVAYWPSLKWEE